MRDALIGSVGKPEPLACLHDIFRQNLLYLSIICKFPQVMNTINLFSFIKSTMKLPVRKSQV
jgi:hypothetical protein